MIFLGGGGPRADLPLVTTSRTATAKATADFSASLRNDMQESGKQQKQHQRE
jgi:hypothetical protein